MDNHCNDLVQAFQKPHADYGPVVMWFWNDFITEDGTPFHQSQWRDILTKYNAGFIIVRDYDESQEPWHKKRS